MPGVQTCALPIYDVRYTPICILPQTVAVVSSEYHLYRAKYWADKAGFTALGVPAETTLPVLRLNYFLREGAAVGRLLVLGY